MRDDRSRRPLFALFAAALILRLALLPYGGYGNDVGIFVGWSHVLSRVGTHALYATAADSASPAINYPPGYALVLAAVTVADGALARVLGTHGDTLLRLLLKAPAALADLAEALVVFVLVRHGRGARDASVAAAIALFAPWTWPVSAYWGQVDALCTLGMICAVACVLRGRFTWAWLALAAAVLVKPFPLLIAPLVAIAQYRRDGPSLRLALGPLAGLALAYLVSLPFAPGLAPARVGTWLIAQYTAGQSLFPTTSANAYNVWTVFGAPQSDLNRALGLRFQTWGWLAFATVAGAVAACFARRFGRSETHDGRDRELAVAGFLVLAALFVLATRMHERYLIYALAFAPVVWFAGPLPRAGVAIFGTTFTLDVGLDLFSKHAHVPEIAAVTHAISLVNALALAALVARYLRASPSLPPGIARA